MARVFSKPTSYVFHDGIPKHLRSATGGISAKWHIRSYMNAFWAAIIEQLLLDEERVCFHYNQKSATLALFFECRISARARILQPSRTLVDSRRYSSLIDELLYLVRPKVADTNATRTTPVSILVKHLAYLIPQPTS